MTLAIIAFVIPTALSGAVDVDHRIMCLALILLGAMLLDRTIDSFRKGVVDSSYLRMGSIHRARHPRLFMFWCTAYGILWSAGLLGGLFYLLS